MNGRPPALLTANWQSSQSEEKGETAMKIQSTDINPKMSPTLHRKLLATTACVAALMFAIAGNAQAMTITGTVGPGPAAKYLLTGSPVNVTTNTVFKMSFETTTVGENLALCAGSVADFAAGKCTTQLNDSGGPGFRFLTIVDAASLNGKHIYVIKEVGINPASFTFTIE
jgi:hypothetical protein